MGQSLEPVIKGKGVCRTQRALKESQNNIIIIILTIIHALESLMLE